MRSCTLGVRAHGGSDTQRLVTSKSTSTFFPADKERLGAPAIRLTVRKRVGVTFQKFFVIRVDNHAQVQPYPRPRANTILLSGGRCDCFCMLRGNNLGTSANS